MPRPTKSRSSLPGHSKAARLPSSNKNDEDSEMSMNAEAGPSSEPMQEEEPVVPRPPTKQKKADKLYERREALLAKITAGVSPYSKSHNRRINRAARPSENLVTSLESVEDSLVNMREEEEVKKVEEKLKTAVETQNGKGKEKLTARKRSRVLLDEAARLPAVMSNPAFTASPWETIRLHTLNTMEALKIEARPKANKIKNRR